MKPHYTCPIKAAYMSKYFGVYYYDPETNKQWMWDADGQFYYTKTTPEKRNASDGFYMGCPLHIHPDSLHIFHPKVGDGVRIFSGKVSSGYWLDEVTSIVLPNDESYPYTGDGRKIVLADSIHPDWRYIDNCTIIMKNNQPFFMYEGE